MDQGSPSVLSRVFRFVVDKRWWVIAFYAILLGPSVFYALKVGQDNSIDRLIVQSDPDAIAAHDFAKVFGSGEYLILLAEAPDPFAPGVVARIDELEQRLAKLPHVTPQSILSVYRRGHPDWKGTPDEVEALRKFATGTDLFSKQGLVGPGFLGIACILDVHSTDERHAAVLAINQAVQDARRAPDPFTAIRKTGQPYVNDYLDQSSREAGLKYFPLFGIFVILLNLALYKSFRTLLAFIATLGVNVAMTVGYVGLTGGTFTIVSSVVPMTVLITCTATLVYLHSRFVEKPADRPVDEHQVFALENKFLACTASIFATAVGFAALVVSKIRPIREMGVWVAVGLGFTWVIVFTLFPALQRALRTPTRVERAGAHERFVRFTGWLTIFSYRFRWLLVPAALVVCALGAVALFGLPGVISPMSLQMNSIDYVNHDTDLYKDTKKLEANTAGMSIIEVWLKGQKYGSVTDGDVLRGIDDFRQALERDPQVGAVVGPTTILRTLRYLAGQGDQMPSDEKGLDELTDLIEGQLPHEPLLQRYIDAKTLSQTHLSVITKTVDYQGYLAFDKRVHAMWDELAARTPALKGFELRTCGLYPLEAKISYHLVPTLTESFGLTVIIIFGTFLVVFRNGAARVMAMIPSLVAILAMFIVMRVGGMTLNAATILIASTVLGTSENDQIHFFYHFQEKWKQGTTEEGLRHTLVIAGRAIFYATLINAGGFLAFALADLPPIAHFGILSACAFLVSMIADFTALPAALWLVFRDKPDRYKQEAPSHEPPPAPVSASLGPEADPGKGD